MLRICECVAIWETGEWPEEWTFSTFIPLPKKGDLKQCANYRRIALVSHTSKTLLRIILERIRVKTETEIADEQAGFRAPTTSVYVLCGLQEGVLLCFP